ncbi:LAMI_0F02696g1_1 [Lachancea mirantina]|uniref:LAMI_0F02696g1_1 n=1 Tax=Lachancea mirantina TaxID=1230905 RepID=A0A1G4JWN4_9SACH|nr:LAMI_0F02696g1_1 [Lachancea mirantina]
MSSGTKLSESSTTVVKNYQEAIRDLYRDSFLKFDQKQYHDEHFQHTDSKLTRFKTSKAGNPVLDLQFNRKGSFLAYSRCDGSINFWNRTSVGTPRHTYVQCDPDIKMYTLTWNPSDEYQLATTSGTDSITVWDALTATVWRVFEVEKDAKMRLASYDPEGKWLATVLEPNRVQMLDVENEYSLLYEYRGNTVTPEIEAPTVASLAWNNDGSILLCGYDDGKIDVLQVSSSEITKLITLNGHMGCITSMSFDPQDRFFVVGSEDTMCTIWDLESLCCVRVIEACQEPILSIDVSRDGFCVAIVTENSANIYSAVAGELLYEVPSEFLPATRLKFVPDQEEFALSAKAGLVTEFVVPKAIGVSRPFATDVHKESQLRQSNRGPSINNRLQPKSRYTDEESRLPRRNASNRRSNARKFQL